jgi:hypothetical protein
MEQKTFISLQSLKSTGMYHFLIPNNAPIGEAIEFLQEIDAHIAALIEQNAQETRKKMLEDNPQPSLNPTMIV